MSTMTIATVDTTPPLGDATNNTHTIDVDMKDNEDELNARLQKSSTTMMAELFQKSLGIRENGCCHRHPDVTILQLGATCLGSCHFCAMEKQKEMGDGTDTTASNSFFWSSAASLSLTSSFRQGQTNSSSAGSATKEVETSVMSNSEGQATGEENSERQQQEKFFQSIVARWVQIQDGNLQQSIALSTPLLLNQMRKLETKVDQQGEMIVAQQKTILELQKSIETKHDSTQEMLQTIMATLSSAKNNNGGISDTASLLGYNTAASPPTTRGVPRLNSKISHQKRRTSTSSNRSAYTARSQRTVESAQRQPMTRHDSNRSFVPAASVTSKGGKYQRPVSTNEIALDGSSHSFDRTDLPDIQDIFDDGMGGTIASAKKKRFQIPASYARRARQEARPMEIILESSDRGAAQNISNSERKMLPTSPEEMGMDMGASLTGNAKAFVEHQTAGANANKQGAEGGAKKKTKEEALEEARISLISLDAASAASELSDSDSSEYDDEEEEEGTIGDGTYQSKQAPSWVDSMIDDDDDDDANDYAIEDLQHVSRYKMIDMYGDRGTYTGTLGPDNDPSGFGTMKYESGRFYKGEWRKGRWNGKGTLLNANGDSYQGDFVSDARHGRGVYRFTSGDVYEGDFFEDNRHGKGKFKFHNGSIYTGDFCMGSFEGQGRYDFEGGFYEGSWKRDEYYGKGKLQYKDGSNYTGKFKRGSAHGFGEERLADGTVRCGLWKRGEFLQECTEEECKRLESKSAGAAGRKNKRASAQDV